MREQHLCGDSRPFDKLRADPRLSGRAKLDGCYKLFQIYRSVKAGPLRDEASYLLPAVAAEGARAT